MFNFIKSLFKPTTIQVNNIQDLFPFYDPDKFVIGVKKGTMSKEDLIKLKEGKTFQYLGSANNFIILPKSQVEESSK